MAPGTSPYLYFQFEFEDYIVGLPNVFSQAFAHVNWKKIALEYGTSYLWRNMKFKQAIQRVGNDGQIRRNQ